MTRQTVNSEGSVILYDEALISHIDPQIFEPGYWPDAPRTAGKAGGRGAALFINHAGHDWVLRHYYRGGLAGRLLTDRYLWTGESNVRSFREWDLLRRMRDEGLPVPVPVAARYVRHGFSYSADLITVRLADVTPLSLRLSSGAVSPELWAQIGACIARFHHAGFCHADLNAHNIQISSSNEIYLLDWDRGDQRVPSSWRNSNLARLHRSLNKLSAGGALPLNDWQRLINGYVDTLQALPEPVGQA